jgi:hypothetical protein
MPAQPRTWATGWPRFRLTTGDLAERDLLATSLVREREIPLGVDFSGGDSAESRQIHADSIQCILARFDHARDSRPPSARPS